MTTSALTTARNYLLATDPILKEVIIATSSLPPLVPHTDYYKELVEGIIGQQLSIKAAAAIIKRFVALFDTHFPTPDEIIKCPETKLRSVGMSRPKIRYIKDLSEHILDGRIRFTTLDQLSNDKIIAELTQVKGIGEWTVHMFLIFCMGRLDVLPTGDLGIKNGIKHLYGREELPSADDIRQIALDNKWHPYESVASWYIWQSLSAPVQSAQKSPPKV